MKFSIRSVCNLCRKTKEHKKLNRLKTKQILNCKAKPVNHNLTDLNYEIIIDYLLGQMLFKRLSVNRD